MRNRVSERRESAKAEILDAAWRIARAEGLAAVSLGEIARAVGMRPPSLYNYFDSKNAIYDAMFAQGAEDFVRMEPWDELTGELVHDLSVMVHAFVGFCAEDPARYQLLFQRTIPGFEPSPESFAISEASLGRIVAHLEQRGVTDPRAIDLFTAIGTGLADQQISNDPGGDRWIRLIDDAVEMFADHLTKAGGSDARRTPAKGNRAT